MKKLILIIVYIICCSVSCVAQGTGQLTDEQLYKDAEKALTLYADGNYTQARSLLKAVAESGRLDKPSMGMIAYYLCDCYYEEMDSLENGSLEKYEMMKEAYKWMLQVDWQQFEELNPTDVRINVVSAYVTAIHFYSENLTDIDSAILVSTLMSNQCFHIVKA